MNDPVQVIAEVLEEFGVFIPLAAAREAVHALKANPDALAALLDPWGYGDKYGNAESLLDDPCSDAWPFRLYRIPEAP